MNLHFASILSLLIGSAACTPSSDSAANTDSSATDTSFENPSTSESEKIPDDQTTVIPPVEVSGVFLASAVMAKPTSGNSNYVLGVTFFCDENSRIICTPEKYDSTLTSIEDCKIYKDNVEVNPVSRRNAANLSDFWQYEVELAPADFAPGKMTMQCGTKQPERIRSEAVTVTLRKSEATYLGDGNEPLDSSGYNLNIGRSFQSLIRFELTDLPPNVLVRDATFEAYAYFSNMLARALPVTAYRMLKPWEESAANNEFYAPGLKWQPIAAGIYKGPQPGIDLDPTEEDVFVLPHFMSTLPNNENLSDVDSDGRWLALTMTRSVINWVAVPSNNFGINLRGVLGFNNSYEYSLCSDDPIAYTFPPGLPSVSYTYDPATITKDLWNATFPDQHRFCTPGYANGESRVPKLTITYYP